MKVMIAIILVTSKLKLTSHLRKMKIMRITYLHAANKMRCELRQNSNNNFIRSYVFIYITALLN